MSKVGIASGKRVRTDKGTLPQWQPPLSRETIRGVRIGAQRVFKGDDKRSAAK